MFLDGEIIRRYGSKKIIKMLHRDRGGHPKGQRLKLSNSPTFFEFLKKERDVIEEKPVEKHTFFEKTPEQNLTQILIFHIFKMTEKTCFFQLTGFLGDVMAEKHTFFRPLTSSLTDYV